MCSTQQSYLALSVALKKCTEEKMRLFHHDFQDQYCLATNIFCSHFRQKMKHFLKETVKTDNIEVVDLVELKQKMDGDAKGMLGRIKYRK